MTAQMKVHGCGYHKLGLEVCRDIHVKNVDTIQMTHTKHCQLDYWSKPLLRVFMAHIIHQCLCHILQLIVMCTTGFQLTSRKQHYVVLTITSARREIIIWDIFFYLIANKPKPLRWNLVKQWVALSVTQQVHPHQWRVHKLSPGRPSVSPPIIFTFFPKLYSQSLWLPEFVTQLWPL